MFGKLNKNIGFSLMPFAFIFLFEPSYSILDPLPDFIGYAILCFAISNLADIYSKIKDAFTGFRNAMILSVLKLVAMLILNRIFYDAEQTVGVLLFVFIFSIFEIIILLPAYKNFFDGLLHLGIFHDGTAVYFTKEKTVKKYDKRTKSYITKTKRRVNNASEGICALSIATVIIKAIMVTLPELTTLASNSYYEFIIILRVMSIIVVLPLGIVWLVKMIKYTRSVAADKPFINSLSEEFDKHARQNPQFYTVRTVIVGLSMICISLILSADIYSDGINYLPDYFSFILMIASVFFLKKYSKRWILPLSSSALGIPISIYHHIAEKSFIAEYDFTLITKDINAYYAYYNVLYARIAESAVFMLTVIFTVVFLWDIYKSHTEIERLKSSKEVKAEKRAFFGRSAGFIIISLLAVAGGIFYVMSQPYYYDAWYYSYSSIISTTLQTIFIFVAVGYTGFVGGSVKYRYRMDL